MNVNNIISFDGGGVKGRMSLEIAAEIEQRTGEKIKDIFSTMAGTSTGGIIVSMLAKGYSARQIANIYDAECKYIFKRKRFRYGVFRTKYDHSYIEGMIKKYLGDIRMRDLDVRLIIPSYRQDTDELVVFDSDDINHSHLYLRDVVRATSSAPTYFKPHSFNYGLYSDGGTILNNPVLWAYAHVMDSSGFDNRYNLVSIGTSREDTPIYWKGGISGWFVKLIPSMMNNQVKLQHRITDKICTGLSDKYWRLEPILKLSSGKIDDGSSENMRNMQIDGLNSVDLYNKQINEIVRDI